MKTYTAKSTLFASKDVAMIIGNTKFPFELNVPSDLEVNRFEISEDDVFDLNKSAETVSFCADEDGDAMLILSYSATFDRLEQDWVITFVTVGHNFAFEDLSNKLQETIRSVVYREYDGLEEEYDCDDEMYERRVGK